MILRNKKGIERNFRVLFELEKNNKKYIVYEDINTLNVYSGKLKNSLIEPLDDKEYKFISNMLDKISG